MVSAPTTKFLGNSIDIYPIGQPLINLQALSFLHAVLIMTSVFSAHVIINHLTGAQDLAFKQNGLSLLQHTVHHVHAHTMLRQEAIGIAHH